MLAKLFILSQNECVASPYPTNVKQYYWCIVVMIFIG